MPCEMVAADGELSDGYNDISTSWPQSDSGEMTALLKPNGSVRGIVAGDIVRRLVARTIAQHMSDVAEAATAPYQYALSTRAGTECIAHCSC